MRKILFLAFLFSVALTAFSQENDVRQLGAFKGVKASEGIDVYLKKGDKESARVEVTGVSASSVITEVSGSSLKIHMASGNYRGKRTVKVYVTYKSIDHISASSAANVFSEGAIKASNVEVSAFSGASVEVAIEAQNVTVETSSAGDVVLEGKSSSFSGESSSGGDIDAYKMETENATVSVSSGAEAKITVSKALTANASSGGSVHYRGNPSKTMTNASSGGSVKKAN